ncbi:trehalase family glycosidase [Escherichia coli]
MHRDLRSAAASGWDFSSRWMDNPQQLNTLRTTRHRTGRSEQPDV